MFSPACVISFFFAVRFSGASGADACTDGLLPQQQETLLLQHQVSVESEQDTGFIDSALALIFGPDGDSKDGNSSENASAAGNESDEASNISNVSSENATGAAGNDKSVSYTSDADGNTSENGSDAIGNDSNGSSSGNATGADGNASANGSAANNTSDVIGNDSNASSSDNATGADGNASANGSAVDNKSNAIGNGSNGSSSDDAKDGNASKNGSAAGNKSHSAGNSSKKASSSNKTTLRDHNASKNGSNSSHRSKNVSAASNVPLPRKELRMFDALVAKLDTARQALASADELMNDFKEQTALEIHYGEKAALAEATKLDALHEMDRMLNESMTLERGVMDNIPNHVKARVLPHASSRAANRSFEASDAAAQAAKLAQVVHVAESNYSAAIAGAFEARRKRDVLASKILKFLNSSITHERNVTGLVEAINRTYYLNLSGDTEIKVKANTSDQNLTEIVKADIERFSPPNTTVTTTTTSSTSSKPEDVPDPSVPSITVTIINGSDNGSDAKKDHEK